MEYGNFRRRAQNRQKACDHEKGSCDQFLTKLNFSNPNKAGDGRIQKKFLIDFDIWNVEIRVHIRKLDQF